MPQGRRKVPFSGKAKKEQLKAKKQSKAEGTRRKDIRGADGGESSANMQKIHFQFSKDGDLKSNRYNLQFYKETPEEIIKQKKIASYCLEPKEEKDLEIDGREFFNEDFDFPTRPKWNFNMNKEELDKQEKAYFKEYIQNIERKYNRQNLSYFELNLETWRQLWRVLEMSDVILFIVDIRFAAMMFPPSLYEYVNSLNKHFILVLNKIDLAPASVVVAWKYYFKERYPNLHIAMFTTLPGYNLIGRTSNAGGLQIRKQRGRIRMAAEGAKQIFDICKTIVGTDIDLSSWEEKIAKELNIEEKNAEELNTDDDGVKLEIEKTILSKKADTSFHLYEKFQGGQLTIGCVGHPNVGKSSLMNALMGKKVVSVSRTPGHTKHFQTIEITKEVRLCDCPGLVFPSKVPKPLQVLMGSYPISQYQLPYIAVKYIAERIDLVSLFSLDHPAKDDIWSALDICDGYAKKRNFVTSRTARLDSFRAAVKLVQLALAGKICLYHRPPGYLEKKAFWSSHPANKTVEWIQAKNNEDDELSTEENYSSDDEAAAEECDETTAHECEETSDPEETDDSEKRGSDSYDDIGSSFNKFSALTVDV